jgi:hypothetical protein
MKKDNAENPRKNNYFLTIISFNDDGKKSYSIVYTAKDYDTCYNFLKDNFSGSIYTSILRYGDLIRNGVDAHSLINFQNPVVY